MVGEIVAAVAKSLPLKKRFPDITNKYGNKTNQLGNSKQPNLGAYPGHLRVDISCLDPINGDFKCCMPFPGPKGVAAGFLMFAGVFDQQ